MTSRHMKPDTSDFLKKFARVLKNPDIKSFQWSDDGKYVVVNWTLCEEERGKHRKALSILKRVEDTTSLRRLLGCHGFKKMARRSSSDVLVFEHHDFVQSREDNKRSKSSGSGYHLGNMEESSPCMSSDVLSDMCFSPIKRKNARSLYQYINYSSPAPVAEPQDPLQHDPVSDPPCTSLSLVEVQRPKEIDPEKSLGLPAEERPLQESIQTSLLPPLSPHPQDVGVSDDLIS
ncbi:uncharacterized protein LOC121723301 isoform X1 [Alosa sapidissima]|uniref:uncharacterized protein LOC121723301 isoform X1 n=1 Tax=Alosa sapidissima TaxID=34773 RepID=UPI001C084B20|nr:uncharacterized protein LOC121723301 isoform X1 [Alosa sapidissima]